MPDERSNEQQAEEFLASVAKNYQKHLEHLRIQKLKWRATDALDADDVLQDAILKCHDKISRCGLTEGFHYFTYLNTAIANNFGRYHQKSRRSKDESFEKLMAETALNSSVDYADYKVIHKSLAPKLHELSVDFTEFDRDCQQAQDAHYATLTAAFEALPEKYQELLRMDMEGLKYKEMCRVLGLKMGQVKMRIKTGRDLIKAKLGAYPKTAND